MTFDFIILCLFSGSKLGSPVTSAVTRRQSRVYFVDCKGILTPILRTWVQKSTLLLQNRGHAEVLKKTQVRPPSVPECPHRACNALVHSKFRPNGLRNCNLFQGISTYAYANQKHFFAEGLHKLLYARNI